MSEPERAPNPELDFGADQMIALSEGRVRKWAPAWQVVYAILTALGLLSALVADVVVIVVAVGGGFSNPGGLDAKLALAVVLPVMTFVGAWLFWIGGVKPIADLRTNGEFSRTRSEAFHKADRRFGVIALCVLMIIPIVPIFAMLD